MDARCQKHWHPGRTLKREEGELGQTSQGVGQKCWVTTHELTNHSGPPSRELIKEPEEVISHSILRLPAPWTLRSSQLFYPLSWGTYYVPGTVPGADCRP